MTTRNMSTRGFTLIELIIVLVIIGMLAAVVVSKLDKVPDTANAVINADNITELSKFVQMHSATSGGLAPNGLDTLHSGASLISGPWEQTQEKFNLGTSGDLITTGSDSGVITAINSLIGSATSPSQVHDFNATGLKSLSNYAMIDSDMEDYVQIMGERRQINNCIVLGIGSYYHSHSDVKLANLPRCPLVQEGTSAANYDNYLLLVDVSDTSNPEYVGVVDPLFESVEIVN